MIDHVERYESLAQPQKRGCATEAILTAAFAVYDLPVLVPTADTEPYDLVVEIAGRFRRIRCKTAYRASPDTVAFETLVTRSPGDGYHRRTDVRSEFFAVYDPINDFRYLVPVADAPGGRMEIRVRETGPDGHVGVNWYEEYLLGDQLERLCGR